MRTKALQMKCTVPVLVETIETKKKYLLQLLLVCDLIFEENVSNLAKFSFIKKFS
jgi:hypothetical protein